MFGLIVFRKEGTQGMMASSDTDKPHSAKPSPMMLQIEAQEGDK
jgi:hypothetical protein